MKKILFPLMAVIFMLTACEDKSVDTTYVADRTEDRKENDRSDEISENPEDKRNDKGYVTIDITWDESSVTFFSDSKLMDLSLDDVCQPVLYIEGESVERIHSKTGDIHSEKLTIKDPNEYVNIFIEPCQPNNDCPLDTVTAVITYADGQVKELTADEMKVRGQTGIWYLAVYTQN